MRITINGMGHYSLLTAMSRSTLHSSCTKGRISVFPIMNDSKDLVRCVYPGRYNDLLNSILNRGKNNVFG